MLQSLKSYWIHGPDPLKSILSMNVKVLDHCDFPIICHTVYLLTKVVFKLGDLSLKPIAGIPGALSQEWYNPHFFMTWKIQAMGM